ncbi:Growth arrest-specific protein 2 [Armadillidium vulgare]|nr:Growth arrest-specific protein 2 [Armadillidium vulgare]
MTSVFDSSDSSSTHSTTSGFSLNLDSNNEKSKETVLSKSFSDKISCTKEFDVPFFTVARYRNPKSPTTYEVAAGTSFERSESAKEFRESLQYLETINSNGRYNKEPYNEPPSGCNYSLDEANEISKEWLGKSFDMHYSRPVRGTLVTSRSDTLISDGKNHQSNVPCIQVMVSDNKFSDTENTKYCNGNNPIVKNETFNKTVVRGYINFFENSSPKSRNEDLGVKKRPVSRRASTPLSKSENCGKYQFFYSQISKRNNSLTEVSPKPVMGKKVLIEKKEQLVNVDKNVVDNNSAKAKKKAAYEDARVTDAAEKLNNIPSASHHDSVKDSPKKSVLRENHDEAVEGVDKPSEKESQYMVEVNKKIADSHERQLIPLKEDLADWLSKLLDENLTSENLTESLGKRNLFMSTREVPSLPYKTWDHARRGTFFARDNISNFLRFCGRLGVHSNLLFETEDLVSGSGVRRVVLCLLEKNLAAEIDKGLVADEATWHMYNLMKPVVYTESSVIL